MDLSVTLIGVEPNNVSAQINRALPPKIVGLLKRIGRLADKRGFKVFVVGGFVRDLLLGIRNLDVDIVVERDAIEFARLIAKEARGALVCHSRFGTAALLLADGLKVDFATARTESYKAPAALPDVEFSSIKEDLFRRDFTINAMAVDINKMDFGMLLDFYNGLADLSAKRIRVLHPLSFVDDPTRIFRAVRFEQRYGFKIEPHTRRLIEAAAGLGMLGRTQRQRIRNEIVLLLKERSPMRCVARMAELHELRFLHPKIKFTKAVKALFSSIDKTYSWYKLSLPKKRELDVWLVYLSALLEPLTKEEAKGFIKDFAFCNEDGQRILSIKEKGDAAMLRLRKENPPSAAYKLLEPMSYEAILYLMAKERNKTALRHISDFFAKYSAVHLAITGLDIKAAGLAPGPRYKEILAKALYAKIDGKLRTKADELRYALKIAQGGIDKS